MCRLLGWSSAEPRTLAELLDPHELAQLAALSRKHADGWGMAWYDEDGRLRTLRSREAAWRSPEYAAAVANVRSDAGFLHLRWATAGLAVTPRNTHPFVAGGWALAHNGAIRPVDGLLPLLGADAELVGETDSERYLHVLRERVLAAGLEQGLRRTVADICRDLTPSSLNAMLLADGALTAVCCHGSPSGDGGPDDAGPPEERPGYFDLRVRRSADALVISSQPLDDEPWERLDNGTALTVRRGGGEPLLLRVGAFPAPTRERERLRRLSA